MPYGNRYDFTSYTAFTTPAYIITYPIMHPNQPLPLPYTYTGLLPNNNPSCQQGFEQDFFSPSFCARGWIHGNCGYLSSWFPGGVRFPFEEDSQRLPNSSTAPIFKTTSRCRTSGRREAGTSLRRLQLSDSYAGRSSALRFLPSRINGSTNRTSISRTPPICATRSVSVSAIRSRCRFPACSAPTSTARRIRAFEDIPSYDNSTGKPAAYCGPLANQLCANYAHQLYWLTRDYRYGSFDAWRRRWSVRPSPTSISRGRMSFTTAPRSRSRRFTGAVTTLSSRPPTSSVSTIIPVRRSSATSRIPISAFKKLRASRRSITKDLPLGISMQSAPRTSASSATSLPDTFLQPAALALGLVYRSPDLSPFQINTAFNYQNAHGWRIDPVIGFNVGYPYGQGYYTAVYCNGIPVVVPASSLSVIYSQTPGYIDPLDPALAPSPISRQRAAFTNRDWPAVC